MKYGTRFGGVILLVMLVAVSGIRGNEGNAQRIRDRGFKYILHHQNQDGSYGQGEEFRVGKTALVLYALASGERAYRMEHGPFISNAVAYVRKQKNEDGSYGATDPLWETHLVAMAFTALQSPALAEEVTAATAWVDAQRKVVPNEGADPATLSAAQFQTAHSLAKTLGQMAYALVADDTLGAETNVDTEDGSEAAPMVPLLPGTFEGDSVYAILWGVQLGIDKSIHGAAWLDTMIAALQGRQDLADEMGARFGMIEGATDTLEADPIVSTALGCIAAELLKTNYKRLTADAPAE